MKGLTLWQAWASLVGRGKANETRHWRTHYRGRIAIHSARNFPEEARELALTPVFQTALTRAGLTIIKDRQDWSHNLPLGKIVATATLVDCVSTERFLRAENFAERRGEEELAFGNYEPHRWVWLLADIRLLRLPVAAKGARALWEVDDDLFGAIVRQELS